MAGLGGQHHRNIHKGSSFSIWLVYTLVTPPFKGKTEALQNAKGAITIFVVQEILSLFYPEIIGTFDIGDILYYLLGAWIIFEGDVKQRNEEPFHAYQLKYGSATAYSDESHSS
ncbi:MAG: hypothetical protein JJU34_05350 [Lunatimonas sp.]|uniref:hypothetical protein n=1 Tax=Lunatimonas sp. TaxID=2060141 RepID=UPI00263B76B5|nr:hypothetical protein [Lunatimonas sp.]MCC5936687.1 hypothetical protein [Lunatimonas sp.]